MYLDNYIIHKIYFSYNIFLPSWLLGHWWIEFANFLTIAKHTKAKVARTDETNHIGRK
jgi:hypothetical protein